MTKRSYPSLFECRDGTTYLVLEDPHVAVEPRAVVLRLDGEPTTWYDTSKIFFDLTKEILDGMACARRDY
jgi:hypothetical protein